MISAPPVRPVVSLASAWAGAGVVSVVLTFSPIAHAQADAGHEDLQTLEKNLKDESEALSTADCATACRALASIRRAADKICALDMYARCSAARAKAEEATRRVREACPDCAIASAPLPAPPREERAMGKGGHPDAVEVNAPASAPRAEAERGGCRSCTTSGSSPGDLSMTALAVAALAFKLRRRRATRAR